MSPVDELPLWFSVPAILVLWATVAIIQWRDSHS